MKREATKPSCPDDVKGKDIAKGKGKQQHRGIKGKGKPFFNEKGMKDAFPKQNDPAFYNKYHELTQNAARIAFAHRNGANIQFAIGNTATNRNIDPIAIMTYVPIPGRTLGLTSGINISANAAYKVLNRKYRGSPASRYEMADLGISQFAIMDFYLSLAQAERIYGLCQVARVNQLQVPRELVFALGFDYEDIANNLADFRAKLNALIVRAQVLCLVKGYSLLDHHMFLLSNVFKDKDTARANYFAYRKPGYWLWDPTSFTTGSSLKWVTSQTSRSFRNSAGPGFYFGIQTADDVITNLNAQLNALLSDSDIDAICADILALFDNDSQNNNLIRLQFLPDGYNVEPIFAQEALYQWHNTIIPNTMFAGSSIANRDYWNDVNRVYATPYPTSLIPSGDSTSNHTGLIIYQVDGRIQFDIQTAVSTVTQIIDGTMTAYGSTSTNAFFDPAPLLDTDILNPSPDEIVEMTRQTSTWNQRSVVSSGSNYYINFVTTIGTVLVASMTLFSFYGVGQYAVDSNGDYNYASNAYSENLHSYSTTFPASMSKFDWHPMIYGASNDVYGDLDNYRSIELPVLRPIHEAATLSEFHNPISDILVKDL